VPPPALDDDLGLAESVEDFAVEQLVAQASVEALDVAVLPGAAPLERIAIRGNATIICRLGSSVEPRFYNRDIFIN
jgi:hypothetical protein